MGNSILRIKQGGTGASTANNALNNLLPSQTGNSGKVLGTDGSNTSWVSQTGGGSPGGTSGQVQYNNSGSFGGFTVGGDATLDTSTGALTVTKTNGTSFAASATTDTTSASNISSGTLPNARLSSIPNSALNTMADKTFKGNVSGSSDVPSDLSVTQMNRALNSGIVDSSTSRTLSATDVGQTIFFTSSSAVTVTVPSSTFQLGDIINFVRMGTGTVTFAGSGVTVNYESGTGLTIAAQYTGASLAFQSSTVAAFMGRISA